MRLISEFDGQSLGCKSQVLWWSVQSICRGSKEMGHKIWELRTEIGSARMEVKELVQLGKRKGILHKSGTRKNL